MTFNEIKQDLRKFKLPALDGALDRAVREESEALIDNNRKRTPAAKASALEAAQGFYAEDITRFLATKQALTPGMVLYQRRMATAWAIAQEILRAVQLVARKPISKSKLASFNALVDEAEGRK